MDWTKVKSAIGTIAPWIAGTLGSPVAGVAVKALCDTFGLAGDSATPEGIASALAVATPEQLTTLKLAELKHAEFMRQLGYTHIEQLEQLTVADRDSARKRETDLAKAGSKDNTDKVLAGLSVVLFIALIWFVSTGQVNEAMRDGFWMLAGAAVSIVKDVYGYYFGSSHGSQAKDATIAAQAGVEK
jgi:hypothetical protein